MDVGFWLGAVGGFVTFVISLWLSIKEKREGDADWKWAAVLAAVGLVGTVVSIQQGIAATIAAKAAENRLSKAESDLEAANKALESTRNRLGSRLAMLLEGKIESLTEELARIPNRDSVPLIFRRSSGDLDTHEFSLGMLSAFRTAGWLVDPLDIVAAESHSPPVAGIRVEWAKDDEATTETAMAIFNTLSEAGIGFVTVNRHPTVPAGKVRIVIGEKPLARSSREDAAK